MSFKTGSLLKSLSLVTFGWSISALSILNLAQAPAPAPAGRGGRGGAVPAPAAPTPNPNSWENRNMAMLDNASLKKALKLLWFAIGKDDNVIGTTAPLTVDLLKKHGFNPVFEHSEGGHTWINWRNYLNTFAPQLFK